MSSVNSKIKLEINKTEQLRTKGTIQLELTSISPDQLPIWLNILQPQCNSKEEVLDQLHLIDDLITLTVNKALITSDSFTRSGMIKKGRTYRDLLLKRFDKEITRLKSII